MSNSNSNVSTTQMILWLAVPMALSGGFPLQVMAADVLEIEGDTATVALGYGTLDVTIASRYVSNDGDVSAAIGWVEEAGFIDFRQG